MTNRFEIRKEETQQDRYLEQDEEPWKYGHLTLESSGRDCDGPHTHKEKTIYVTEEEALDLITNHFGFHGWSLEIDGRESFFHRRDKTDEGYVDTEAHLYWPPHEDT